MVHIKYIHLNLWRNIGLITEKGTMHITGIGILDKITWGKKIEISPKYQFHAYFLRWWQRWWVGCKAHLCDIAGSFRRSRPCGKKDQRSLHRHCQVTKGLLYFSAMFSHIHIQKHVPCYSFPKIVFYAKLVQRKKENLTSGKIYFNSIFSDRQMLVCLWDEQRHWDVELSMLWKSRWVTYHQKFGINKGM